VGKVKGIEMGFDIYGMDPSAPEGKYFRRSVSGWPPLAEFIIKAQPEIAGKLIDWNESSPDCTINSGVRGWYYNDGDGFDAELSVLLADKLDEMLANGNAEAYIKTRNLRLKQLPNETCSFCQGTGIRTEKVADAGGCRENPRETRCGCCSGRGWQPNFETRYHLDADDIRQFSEFLRTSGGFQIW
jgi:hypothetical protein